VSSDHVSEPARPDPGYADRSAWTQPTVESIAEGVFRIPLPMPGDALKAVNVYALEQPDGFTLIDGGWAQANAREQLEASMRRLGAGLSSIKRILVTHAHRDHYTLAIILRREFGMPVALGAGEKESIAVLTGERHAAYQSQVILLRGAGADELIRDVERRAVFIDPVLDGWEPPDEWLEAGTLAAGGRELTSIPTPGHTRGHLVFADLDHGLLFAGDHVLPHITPSIGVDTVSTPVPLADFLGSLAVVRALPDLKLLPAHGPVTASSHARVDELVLHHDQRLEEIRQTVAGSTEQTARWIAGQLAWTRRKRHFDELDTFNQMLAICETIAHLVVLKRSGLVSSRIMDGVVLYAAHAG
jgi:glyoxylase-like metal-dependent hydrolase (beta-lactamase superfamily II)